MLPLSRRTTIVRFGKSMSSHRRSSLAHSQTMAIDQEADQPIALPMAIAFQRGKQPGHFVLGQVLADPIGRVRLAPSRCDLSHLVLFTSLRRGDFMGLPTMFNA